MEPVETARRLELVETTQHHHRDASQPPCSVCALTKQLEDVKVCLRAALLAVEYNGRETI